MAERLVIHHPQEPHRPTTISRRHFDPDKHRLWKAPEEDDAPTAEAETRTYSVVGSAGWWKVVDADGEQHGTAQRSEEEAEQLRDSLEASQ